MVVGQSAGGSAMKIFEKLDLAANAISKLCLIIAGILLAGVTVMICAGVINRAFSLGTWLFVEEWSGLVLIPISFLAFSYTLRCDKHLKMDLIVRKMNKKWQDIMAIFSGIFSLICLVFMIIFSWNWYSYTVERDVVSSGPMETPLWIFSLIILVAMVLFAIDMFLYTINKISSLILKKAPLKFEGDSEPINLTEPIAEGGESCK